MSSLKDITALAPADYLAPALADQRVDLTKDPCPAGTLSAPCAAWRRSPWYRRSRPVLLAVVILIGLHTFVGEASVVPTGSMEGTILVGDHLFLNKLLYGPEIPLLN